MAIVTKTDAAQRLLDGALAMHRAGDHVCAIVLAGAAEDILQGALQRAGRSEDSSRRQIAAAWDEGDQKEPADAMRAVYNWLRHNDRDDDGQARRIDVQESSHALMRAADNLFALTEHEHPCAAELGYPVGNRQ